MRNLNQCLVRLIETFNISNHTASVGHKLRKQWNIHVVETATNHGDTGFVTAKTATVKTAISQNGDLSIIFVLIVVIKTKRRKLSLK